MTAETRSIPLRQHYKGRFDIPLLILVAAALLITGLSLPLVHVEKMVMWQSTYSVFTGTVSLFEQKEFFLGAVLFFFSMVFPIIKLVGLAFIWYCPMKSSDRKKFLHWLGLLGKWSMLDVFIVAILIVAVKLGPLANIEPRQGVYFFCLAILFSMISTTRVDQLARKILR